MPPDISIPRPNYLIIGEVLRPHGVRGELRIRLLTDYPERIAQLKQVYLGLGVEDPRLVAYPVEAMRRNQAYGLLKLGGVNDRNQAEFMRQLFVMVAIEDAVPLEEGEVYLYQLVGMRVQTSDGVALGTLTEVLETGANDVYVVQGDTYGELLIPATPQIIVKTDAEARLITINPPYGLLPEN